MRIPPFPIVVSDGPYYDETVPVPPPPPPPAAARTPGGADAYAELADAGVTLLRTGFGRWTAAGAEQQIAAQAAWLARAAEHGLGCLVWLGALPDIPARAPGAGPGPREQLLRNVVSALRDRPGLAAWKGIDEPANLYRGDSRIPPAGMQRALAAIHAIDPDHPVVVTQAPRNIGDLAAYTPTFDVTGVDVYPIAYPPGLHVADTPSDDLGVVGDSTRRLVAVAGGKPVWTTLQIAWSGVTKPTATLRFPTFAQQRFMAWDAIAAGARGLIFFGGHLTRAGDRPLTKQRDIAHGWNWTFWENVLRRLVVELSAGGLAHPLLVAPDSPLKAVVHLADAKGKPTATVPKDVRVLVRETATAVFLVVLKRGGTATVRVHVGLAGQRLRDRGYVLGEEPRMVGTAPLAGAAGGGSGFADWLAPWDVHVYKIGKA